MEFGWGFPNFHGSMTNWRKSCSINFLWLFHDKSKIAFCDRFSCFSSFRFWSLRKLMRINISISTLDNMTTWSWSLFVWPWSEKQKSFSWNFLISIKRRNSDCENKFLWWAIKRQNHTPFHHPTAFFYFTSNMQRGGWLGRERLKLIYFQVLRSQ